MLTRGLRYPQAMAGKHRALLARRFNIAYERSARYRGYPSLPIHIGDDLPQSGGLVAGELIEFLFQSLFADGANLVYRDLAILSRALDLNPGSPLGVEPGG